MKLRYTLCLTVFVSQIVAKTVHQSVELITDAMEENIELRHVTPHLLNIAKNGYKLNSDIQTHLKGYGFQFKGKLVNRSYIIRDEASGLGLYFDSGLFRFHYTLTGKHAVSDEDLDGTGIPDYIENMAAIFDSVAYIQHTTLGYEKPPSDGWYSSTRDKGGSDHYDVYLRNLPSSFYGYVQPEDYALGNGNNEHTSRQELNAFTSYMAMRNNYNGFPHDEYDNIRVTVAHEYFHAVQFGYDGWEEPWVLEATAVWMEEVIYDDINDCYQYMPDWFNEPQRSLDSNGSHWYGSFIFFQYIEEHLGGKDVMKNIFDLSVTKDSNKGNYSHWAIHQALEISGATFTDALNQMAVANQIMSSFPSAGRYSYEEAFSYPVQHPRRMAVENFQTGNKDTLSSVRLEKFASQYIQVFTSTPVRIDLLNESGPLSDLQLHAILKKNDNSYKVLSSPSVNIDPVNLKSINLAVVSQDTLVNNWDFIISFKDGVPGTDAWVPMEFILGNPYPNPFNGTMHISIYLFDDLALKVDVIDLSGRTISTIANRVFQSGNYLLKWNGRLQSGESASSGIYYIRVSGKDTQEWKPITYVK